MRRQAAARQAARWRGGGEGGSNSAGCGARAGAGGDGAEGDGAGGFAGGGGDGGSVAGGGGDGGSRRCPIGAVAPHRHDSWVKHRRGQRACFGKNGAGAPVSVAAPCSVRRTCVLFSTSYTVSVRCLRASFSFGTNPFWFGQREYVTSDISLIAGAL